MAAALCFDPSIARRTFIECVSSTAVLAIAESLRQVRVHVGVSIQGSFGCLHVPSNSKLKSCAPNASIDRLPSYVGSRASKSERSCLRHARLHSPSDSGPAGGV